MSEKLRNEQKHIHISEVKVVMPCTMNVKVTKVLRIGAIQLIKGLYWEDKANSSLSVISLTNPNKTSSPMDP